MHELESITALLRAQRCLVTRGQATACGLSERSVDHRLASGRWERVHPTVYGLAGVPWTWHRAALAATLWRSDLEPALLSHEAGSHLWGLDDATAPPIELLVGSSLSARANGVRVHRTAHLPASHRSTRHGIPVTSPERTLMDVASQLSAPRLERSMERAIRLRLVTPASLLAVADEFGGRRRGGVGTLRRLLDDRRPGGDAAPDGELEIAAWHLIRSSGLPLPTRQHVLTIDGVDWSIDFFWPATKVGLETDGYASHQSLTAFRQDRLKMRALTSAGCRILPATWDDVTRRPDRLLDDIARAFGHAAG